MQDLDQDIDNMQAVIEGKCMICVGGFSEGEHSEDCIVSKADTICSTFSSFRYLGNNLIKYVSWYWSGNDRVHILHGTESQFNFVIWAQLNLERLPTEEWQVTRGQDTGCTIRWDKFEEWQKLTEPYLTFTHLTDGYMSHSNFNGSYIMADGGKEAAEYND